MSRIIGDLQRFQVPYTLVEVPELQTLLSNMLEGPLKHGQDAQSLCEFLQYPSASRSRIVELIIDASSRRPTISHD